MYAAVNQLITCQLTRGIHYRDMTGTTSARQNARPFERKTHAWQKSRASVGVKMPLMPGDTRLKTGLHNGAVGVSKYYETSDFIVSLHHVASRPGREPARRSRGQP